MFVMGVMKARLGEGYGGVRRQVIRGIGFYYIVEW